MFATNSTEEDGNLLDSGSSDSRVIPIVEFVSLCDSSTQTDAHRGNYVPTWDSITQTDVNYNTVDALSSEIQRLRSENLALRSARKYSITYLSFLNHSNKVEEINARVLFFTGLPTLDIVKTLFDFLEPHIQIRKSFDKFESMIIVLMRLRMDLSFAFMSHLFLVSTTTIRKVFTHVLHVMYVRLQPLVFWPERDALQKTMPMEFRKHYGMKCVSIIDCFEVRIEKPSNLKARCETYSSYKSHNTVKFLISITPQGVVSFISKAWTGRSSDKCVTVNSGYLNFINPGDIILADRGFDIGENIGLLGAQVKTPAFTRGKPQLSPAEIESSRNLAHVRIHIERVIGLVRSKYKILSSIIPLEMLKEKDKQDLSSLDQIAFVCCAMVNLCPPIIPFD